MNEHLFQAAWPITQTQTQTDKKVFNNRFNF